EVLLPIKLQHLLGQCHRNPPRRSLPPPLIKQPIVAKLLVAFPPPPHPAVADAYDLRRLPPSDPFRHRPYNHFLHFHRPLHRALRVTHHASHGLLLSPPAKRTDHLLFQADISSATNRVDSIRLTTAPGKRSLAWKSLHLTWYSKEAAHGSSDRTLAP